MADIKNFGIKGIAADVQMGKSGGRLKYDSGNGSLSYTKQRFHTRRHTFCSVTLGTWTGTAPDLNTVVHRPRLCTVLRVIKFAEHVLESH